MSNADLAAPTARPLSRPDRRLRRGVTPLAIAIGFVVSLALCWGGVRDAWTTGNFYDPDDAMRMVQVRDFLAGQSWYDLTAWRLDPPNGSFMHWSRVVDLPLALLMRIFGSHAPGDAGERLARIAFPLLLQLGLLASIAWVGRVLFGARGVAITVALTVLSGFMLGQFVPGRVDHHAPQIVLLVLMTGCMLAALDPTRARLAALSAFCAALSLSISVENLPFIFALVAAPPIAWIVVGAPARSLLRWFAGGLCVATPLCFAIFNAPTRWIIPACDAFSYDHVLVAWGAALVCGAMALATRWQASILSRTILGVTTAVIVGVPLAYVFLHCLIDPFTGLDPLVRDIWLNNVGEARPALKHFALFPRSVQTIVIPTLIGLAGIGLAIRRENGVSRARFVLLFAFAFVGCALTGFMIRASTSLAPVALLGCAWLAVQLATFLERRGLGHAAGLTAALAATIPLSSIGWAAVPTLMPDRVEAPSSGAVCLPAVNYAALAAQPRGLVLAPIDLGAHILAHTPHSAVTAPYHRNNRGNRLAIDIFMAAPDAARDMARASGAKYLVVCKDAKELRTIASRNPDSFAGRLINGDMPAWLRPVGASDALVATYEITKS